MAFTVDRSRSIISAMILGRKVTAMDVAWLRREVFADGAVSREAADELFLVERAGVAQTPGVDRAVCRDDHRTCRLAIAPDGDRR